MATSAKKSVRASARSPSPMNPVSRAAMSSVPGLCPLTASRYEDSRAIQGADGACRPGDTGRWVTGALSIARREDRRSSPERQMETARAGPAARTTATTTRIAAANRRVFMASVVRYYSPAQPLPHEELDCHDRWTCPPVPHPRAAHRDPDGVGRRGPAAAGPETRARPEDRRGVHEADQGVHAGSPDQHGAGRPHAGQRQGAVAAEVLRAHSRARPAS